MFNVRKRSIPTLDFLGIRDQFENIYLATIEIYDKSDFENKFLEQKV